MKITTSTCIVGIKEDDNVYIAGDSLGSSGSSGTVYKNKKVFHLQNRKEIIIGYTSSFRMGQLIQYSNTLFNDDDFLIKDRIDEKYLVNTFIPNLQSLLSRGGYQEEEKAAVIGGTFLLGYKNKLYKVQEDYSILESENSYISIGCGEDFALGSLHTTENLNMSIMERLNLALESADKFSLSVSKPYYMVSTNDLETKLL